MADPEEKFLSGAQASEFLGVKPATLYAYASRGLLESVPAQSGRERLYRLSELVKLRNNTRGVRNSRENEVPVWTGPLIKSSITEIAEDGHRYRGRNALELAAAGVSFEDVVEILWETGEDPDLSWSSAPPYTISRHLKKSSLEDSDYLDLIKLLLIAVEMVTPVNKRLLAEDIFHAARQLIVSMSLAPALFQDRSEILHQREGSIAQNLLMALSGSKSKSKAGLVNSALVLCADHELNASALAARIAASCDASLFSCLLSALGTFSGIMHGAASRRAEDIVNSSMRFRSARAWLKDYLKHSDTIPGFGTELYSEGDPRARFLIQAARDTAGQNKYLERLIEIVDCVKAEIGSDPNLDFGLAALSYALSLPPGSGSTIFAVSRTAGWIAHAVEQRAYGAMIRPRAKYIGKGSVSPS